jgi:hypothetical protein
MSYYGNKRVNALAPGEGLVPGTKTIVGTTDYVPEVVGTTDNVSEIVVTTNYVSEVVITEKG